MREDWQRYVAEIVNASCMVSHSSLDDFCALLFCFRAGRVLEGMRLSKHNQQIPDWPVAWKLTPNEWNIPELRLICKYLYKKNKAYIEPYVLDPAPSDDDEED